MLGWIPVRIKQLSSSESLQEKRQRRDIHRAERRHLEVETSLGRLLRIAAPGALATMNTDQKFSFKLRASEAKQRCFIPTTSSVCCSWQKVKRAGKEMIGPFKFLTTYHLHQGQGISVYLLLNDLSRCASVPSP